MSSTRIFLFLIAAFYSASAQAEPKPNILFIAIDDMNDWTGFLGGHPQAKTPNMDKLAKHGVNFTNAHCPAPGCPPSRNALLYGVEPFNSGLYAFYEHDLHAELRKKYVSLPQFFRTNGYQTFGAGKIHHGPKGHPQEWSDYLEPTKSGLKLDVESGYQVNGQFKMSFCPTTVPLEDHPDYKVASYGIDVLSKKHDQPFFLAVGIVKPHLPFVCPQQFFDLYPDPVAPPKINADDHDDIPRVGRAMAKRGDDNRFKKDKAWNKVRRSYLACISWADYNVGRVLDALEASPYADNTIVVLWSDHGYAMGEKNHFRKFALWEETTRVPFIIWDRREKDPPQGRTVKDAVSLINIYRTLAELSDLTPPEKVDGFSLVPQLQDPAQPIPMAAICTWGRGNYSVRDRAFRYTCYFDGGEELYAHPSDSDEWVNQADNPEFSKMKQRLAGFLPKEEAPLVTEHISSVRAIMSADKPDRKSPSVPKEKKKQKEKVGQTPPELGQRIQAGETKAPYAYYIRKRLKEGDSTKVPLIISLHGAGGGKRGVDWVKLPDEPFFAATDHAYLFVKPVTGKGWDPDDLNTFIDTMLADYGDLIDPNRIYLYGYSMGGHGSWRYCIDHGDRIAAMMAIEGGFIRGSGPASKYDFSHFKDLPVWAFHNRDDPVVPLEKGQEPVDAAKAAGGSPKFTIHESGEHKMQLQKNLTPEVLDWLFSQSR